MNTQKIVKTNFNIYINFGANEIDEFFPGKTWDKVHCAHTNDLQKSLADAVAFRLELDYEEVQPADFPRVAWVSLTEPMKGDELKGHIVLTKFSITTNNEKAIH